ncbi:peptide ABC transporter substrate-binding protein [Vagococcus sp.]|uniref:peptide ABC transporter substrate-binding protein n=1 Tax=Vagococcus sp. TaxID=1933889 RepID=UPI003F9A09AF
MKKQVNLVNIAVAAVLLTSCGANKTQEATSVGTKEKGKTEQKITISSPTPISTIDTTQTTDKNTFTMVQHLFEGLVRFDKDTQVVPGIAESYDVSPDGLTYTFKIRPEAKWSDGRPITSKDFAYAWKRLVNPKTQGPNAYLLDSVKKSSEIRKGKAKIEEIGLETPDDQTFIVQLETAQPSFLAVASIGWLAPQSEEFVNDHEETYGTTSETTLYNGAFVLENWEGTSDTWTLKKNPKYYDQEVVKLTEVEVQTIKEENTGINLYLNQELDLTKISGAYVGEYKNDPGYTSYLDVSNHFLDFNKKANTVLANNDLRRAVALAIDKEALTKYVLADGSKPLNGLVPRNLYQNSETKEDFRAYSGNYLTYNIKEAKNSWKQAQKKVGQEVALNLLASDDEQGKKVSEYLKSQIEENLTGISIDITLQPKNNVNQLRQDKDYEISLSGWIAGSSELDSYFNLYVGDSAYNYGNFNNSTYNQFVETAKTKHANQPNQQFEDYQQAEIQLLDQEVAQVPIYQSASNYLVSKKLKNIEYPLYGGYFFLRNAEKIN